MRALSVLAFSLLLLGSPGSPVGPAPAAAAEDPRALRTLEFDDYFGVEIEGALPFPPGAGTALLLGSDDGVARLATPGDAGFDDATVLELDDPINVTLAASPKQPRLLVLDDGWLRVRAVGSSQEQLFDWSVIGVERPQGLAVDPASGTVFVLDPAKLRILSIQSAKGNLDAATALADGRVSELALPEAAGSARGLAFDPASGRLLVLSPKAKSLYELSGDGSLLDVRPAAHEAWRQPAGLVVAPSADRTDDLEATSLFLVSLTAAGGELSEWSLETRQVAALAVSERADLIRIIHTSSFSPPSPDPAGVAWDPDADRLLISDSEVNEMRIFQGKNYFESTRTGSLTRSTSTTGFSDEPTGVAIDPDGNRIFISDDTGDDSIYTVELGSDGRLGSGDRVISFETDAYGSGDPEGVAFGNGTLYWVDGVNSEIYWMTSSDGDFDGRRDSVGHFDTSRFGLTDPEGIEWNPANGNLFAVGNPDGTVFEVTPSGSVVREIDISEVNPKKPAGLAIAPSTQGSGWSLFVADRRVDNGKDPNENDGMVYEFAISGGAVAQCGNGVREPGEECDGSDLGGASCSDQGCSSGSLRCTNACTLDDRFCSDCPECGNGVRETGEQCDGSDLGGASCVSEGFYCGTGLSCHSDCTFNTSSCVAGGCGDDLIQSACGELCDGSALGGETCQTQGWGSGDLACSSGCGDYDDSGCSVCDNDGVCEAGEDCGNCPNDCTGGGASCGNDICELDAGEDCRSCPADCNGIQSKRKSKRYCCGDGDGQNPIGCGDARCTAGGNTCDATPVASWCCGNGVCEPAGENTENCAIDCG